MRQASRGIVLPGSTDVPARSRFRFGPELALAAASVSLVLLVLAGLEATLRLAQPNLLADRPQATLARLHGYSEVYGWVPRPGAVAFVDGQRTTINPVGLRGPEHALVRSARPRILLLGDSVAFGYGVADEDTFAAALEARGYEVINLAVPGYGTDQALLRLQYEGVAYRPDVVLLHFCAHNDFADNASRTYFYDGLHPKPYFTLERGQLVPHLAHLKLTAAGRAGLWLHEHSFLYNLFWGYPAPLASDWSSRRTAALRDDAAARDLTVRLVERTALVARDAHASFLLVVHPGRRQARDGSPWLDALRQAPELRAVRQLDMGQQFAARGKGLAALTLDPIGHLSAAGHAETADVLDETLRQVLASR